MHVKYTDKTMNAKPWVILTKYTFYLELNWVKINVLKVLSTTSM